MALIRMNLTSTERTRVMRHADSTATLSPRDLWVFLETAHHHATTGQAFSYLTKFFNFKTSAYATIHEAYEALTVVNAELRRVGIEQPEQTCKFTFLRSLPSRYEAKVDHLKIRMDTKSLFEMKLELEDKKREIKEEDEKGTSHEAMIAKAREDAMTELRAEISQLRTLAAQTKSTRPRKTCSHCQKTGHLEEECWELHPELKQKWESRRGNRGRGGGKGNTNDNKSSESHQAHIASTGFSYLSNHASAMSASSAYWIVDSGASAHLSPDKEHFTSMKPLPEPISIFIGDGRAIHATHSGVIQPQIDKGSSQPLVLTFGDALYVPQASVSLLNIGQASKAGLNFRVEDGRMDLVDKRSQKVIHQIHPTVQNMYRLWIQPASRQTSLKQGPKPGQDYISV